MSDPASLLQTNRWLRVRDGLGGERLVQVRNVTPFVSVSYRQREAGEWRTRVGAWSAFCNAINAGRIVDGA